MGPGRACVAFGLLLTAAAFAGCGDDDSERDHRSDSGTRDAETANHADASTDRDRDRDAGPRGAGTGGRAAAGSGGGGRSGGAAGESSAPDEPAAVQCGDSLCEYSQNTFGWPCCADETTSTCGTAFFGSMCMPIDETKCPDLDFPGLTLPACCTSRGMCGIDTSRAGGPGCLDLATAAQRARDSGATVVFPEPRMCPAQAPNDQDAGADDAGL